MPTAIKSEDRQVDAIRHFNRFYTQQIGVLSEGLLQSSFSLTEARVLYELAHREQPTASELSKELGLDAGYLSRILNNFHKKGLIEKRPSESDARHSLLRLTSKGQKEFSTLDARSHDEVAGLLEHLSEDEQYRLTTAMKSIKGVLGTEAETKVQYIIRQPQPGDIGWVVHRHGVLYGREYKWDEHFEALVARIVSDFIKNFDPKRERCWLAEMNSEVVGSVFLVKQSKTVAKLRLLLVEPKARGLGIGNRLVNECISFARRAGYKKITLWTNDVLVAARHVYERAGFVLVKEEKHHSFGQDLVGQNWELKL